MELEDLVLKHYRVEKVGRKMVAIEDPDGNYKADSAERIERALSTFYSISKRDNIFVKIGKGWVPMSRR